MNRVWLGMILTMVLLCAGLGMQAQQSVAASNETVPALMRFNGVLVDANRKPLTGVTGVTFLLYENQQGGAPLWMETQNVQPNDSGHYTVQLGSTKSDGLPKDLFASGQARWLAVQVEGQDEQPRILLLSVPYALKAADAETLGGMPASAFVQVNPTEALQAATSKVLIHPSSSSTKNGLSPALAGSGTTDFIPLWTSSTNLGNSILFQTGGNVGVGTSTPGAKLDTVGTAIAVRGVTSGTTGSGVTGVAISTTGVNYGVQGHTNSTTSGAAAVNGFEGAATGQVFGVSGTASSSTTNAMGVSGYESATKGQVYGVDGYTASTGPFAAGVGGFEGATTGQVFGVTGGAGSTTNGSAGVNGNENATTGVVYGVSGGSNSTTANAAGVNGFESATKGSVFGVNGNTNSTGPFAAAINGYEGATTGQVFGVNGGTNSVTNGSAGVNGNENATTGVVYGVSGGTHSATANAAGVNGFATAANGAVFGVNGNTNSTGPFASAVNGFEGATTGQVFGVNGSTNSVTNYSAGVSGFEGATTGVVFGVQGGTNSTTNGAAGVAGSANAATGATTGVSGNTNSSTAGANGVFGSASATTGVTFGVQGMSNSSNGVGVQGSSPSTAVAGFNQTCGSTGCILSAGIAGKFVTATAGTVLQGLAGSSFSSLTQVFSVDAAGNGSFSGNLNVTGKLTKGSGSFKIDDPLDPAHMFLSHSFVESPDMMNVYNGNTTTDEHGLATIVLPEYFEALNRDFRYQLTVIGQFAQAIVKQEIQNNRFTIKTSRPSVKVSWQVTGIRHDAYAEAYRIPVEEQKPPREQGHYLHPELFGASEQQAIGAGTFIPSTEADSPTRASLVNIPSQTGKPR